jgi:hypothetical protein
LPENRDASRDATYALIGRLSSFEAPARLRFIALQRRLSAEPCRGAGDFVRSRLCSVHGIENKALTTLCFV